MARLLSVDSLRLADSATIPIALGIAIIRIGCLQRGCCFGKPTDLLWSIIPAPESPAYFHQALRNPVQALMGASPIHPTQLYELLAALLVAAVAFFLIRGQASKGTTSLVAAIIFTSLRWLIFPLREVQSGGEFDAILFPVLYPCLLVALVLVWLVLKWPISGQVKCAPARPE